MANYPSQVPYDWETRSRYMDLPFPIAEYEKRLDRIRKLMEKSGLDCILIFGDAGDPGDLVYISNFIPFGRAAIIVRREKPPILVTDAILHGEPINSYAWMTWIKDFVPVRHDPNEFALALTRVFDEERASRVGIVGSDNLPMSIWERLREMNPARSWRDFWLEFTKVKSIRSDLEVSLQREIGKITAQAMEAAVESISPGKTEGEVAGVAYKTIMELGAHDRSFPTIINSGPRSGIKHSYPTGRRIERGDLIYLDMGAMKFGYQSDMSRSVVVDGASAEQKAVLDVVLNAYQTLLSMMRPGVKTSELVKEAKSLEAKSGLKEKYNGRMYLGLIVHHAIATSFFEFPSLGLGDTVLEPNMTFAFEPMAHILDFGTAVVEDTVLINKTGAESLTPYELVHW